jgi:hypothetical protein
MVLGFAGNTMYAYPILLQAINHMALHPPSINRYMDIFAARGHMERLVADMLEQISDPPRGETTFEEPETLFVVGGYSWKQRAFALWEAGFNTTEWSFVWRPCRGLAAVEGSTRLVVLGAPSISKSKRVEMERQGITPDVKEADDVRVMAFARIAELVRKRGLAENRELDMEPFEVLRDIIRQKASSHVGGPPQLVKVYPNGKSQVFGVLWRDASSRRVAVFGRPLLDYEELDCPLIDPDTLKSGRDLWQLHGCRQNNERE